MRNPELEEAYRLCERLARSHYENFTIGSILLPSNIRRHVWAIYAFCRITDDLGDEAEGAPHKLEAWEEDLLRCYDSSPKERVLLALQDTIKRFEIPPEPFLKLIEANHMEQRIKRYKTFKDLLYYCDHSANPVGHLFLYLFGYRDSQRQKLSDFTCTALQLTNFWQDIALDIKRDHIYIPLEDLQAFGYREEDLKEGLVDERFRRLLKFEIERTRRLFYDGLALLDLLSGPMRIDVKLFSLGGLAVLEAIEDCDYDVFRHRPTLSSSQKAWLLMRALLHRKPPSLRSAYSQCARLTRSRAKNFYYAFLALPKGERQAIYAVYSFCRSLDDIIDGDEPVQRKMQKLQEQRLKLVSCYDPATPLEDPALLALHDTIIRYGIPQEHFEEVLRGVEMDLRKDRYRTFEELHLYCYRVASAVGLICLEIFGYRGPQARVKQHAVELGIAMQLTNILRDIPEDLARGRIYIPQEDMARFSYTEEDLRKGIVNDAFRGLMRYEIERARSYFQNGRELLRFLPQRSRVCPEVLSRLYGRILDEIEARGYDVFRRRISLGSREKLLSLCKGWARSLMSW